MSLISVSSAEVYVLPEYQLLYEGTLLHTYKNCKASLESVIQTLN